VPDSFFLFPGPLVPLVNATTEGDLTDLEACRRRLAWLDTNKIADPADHLIARIDRERGTAQYWPLEPLVGQGSASIVGICRRRAWQKCRRAGRVRACRREMSETGATGRSSFRRNGQYRRRPPPPPAPKQTQQQHLIERIDHLAELARIRHILEVIQKDDCFT
jgi:hypothetical protein